MNDEQLIVWDWKKGVMLFVRPILLAPPLILQPKYFRDFKSAA